MAELGGYVGTVKLVDVLPLKSVAKETTIEPVAACKHEFTNDEIKIFSEFGESQDDYIVLGNIPIEWNTPHQEIMKRHDQLFEKIGEITLTPGGSGK
jgi:hypothetical protein